MPTTLCASLSCWSDDGRECLHGFDATKWPLAIDVASHIRERTPMSCAHWREMQKLWMHLILKNRVRGGSCAFGDYSIVKWDLSIFGTRSLERFWIIATFLSIVLWNVSFLKPDVFGSYRRPAPSVCKVLYAFSVSVRSGLLHFQLNVTARCVRKFAQ